MLEATDRNDHPKPAFHHAQLDYRGDIDGLRAIAVLAVLFHHANFSVFSGGFVGVDIFFVISGYLICSLIYKDLNAGTFSLPLFYFRRAKRILPALVVVMIATTIAGWYILTPFDFHKYGKTLLATAFFVSNFHFAMKVGYFDGIAEEKPLLHTWSLSVEEQFYFIFPLLLIVLSWQFSRRTIVYCLAGLVLAGIVAAHYFVSNDPEKAFYVFHVRIWELLIGAAAAIAAPLVRFSTRQAAVFSAVALAALAYCITQYDGNTLFPGVNALLPCGAAAMLILAGQNKDNPISRLLALRPFIFIGLISYSLYLWHWPIFSLGQYYTGQPFSWSLTLCGIGASVLLAFLSWKYVEQPFRATKLGAGTPVRGTLVGGGALTACAAVAGLIVVNQGFPSRLPANIAAVYDAGGQRSPFFEKCHGVDRALQYDEACNFGLSGTGRTFDMVVWGDSHANHFVPALSDVAKGRGWSGRQVTANTCIPLWGVQLWRKGHVLERCDVLQKAMKTFIERNPDLKLVVLAARWARFGTHEENIHPDTRNDTFLISDEMRDVTFENTRKALTRYFPETLDYLTSRGIKVLVLGQVPEFTTDPVNCFARSIDHRKSPSSCGAKEYAPLDFLRFTNEMIIKAGLRQRMVKGVVMTDFLCNDTGCQVEAQGVPLYRDRNHLNRFGSRNVAPYIARQVDEFMALTLTEK